MRNITVSAIAAAHILCGTVIFMAHLIGFASLAFIIGGAA